MTLDLLWQEYREGHPEGYQYSTFCEHYRAFAQALPVTLRQSHAPGERLFVDYSGQTMAVIDAATGEERPAQIFVAVLGASSYTYVEATWTQGLADWLGSHVRCFEFLGGVPELLVPDNLKSGVTHPSRYEPDLNPSYQELATHYGIAVLPARVRKPRDKAKVEAGVLLAQRWILARLRHQRFFSLAEVNGAIRPLLSGPQRPPLQEAPRLAAERLRGARSPGPQAPAADPPMSSPRGRWPPWASTTTSSSSATTTRCPTATPGQKVDVRFTATTVEVFKDGERIASHPRSPLKGRHTTVEAHLAPAHQEVAGWNAQRFLDWAAKVGPQTQAAIAQVLRLARPPPAGLPHRAGHPAPGQGPWGGAAGGGLPAGRARSSPSATAASPRSSSTAWNASPAHRPRPASRSTTPMCADRSTTTDRSRPCSTIRPMNV